MTDASDDLTIQQLRQESESLAAARVKGARQCLILVKKVMLLYGFLEERWNACKDSNEYENLLLGDFLDGTPKLNELPSFLLDDLYKYKSAPIKDCKNVISELLSTFKEKVDSDIVQGDILCDEINDENEFIIKHWKHTLEGYPDITFNDNKFNHYRYELSSFIAKQRQKSRKSDKKNVRFSKDSESESGEKPKESTTYGYYDPQSKNFGYWKSSDSRKSDDSSDDDTDAGEEKEGENPPSRNQDDDKSSSDAKPAANNAPSYASKAKAKDKREATPKRWGDYSSSDEEVDDIFSVLKSFDSAGTQGSGITVPKDFKDHFPKIYLSWEKLSRNGTGK
jgi:hypothetical protein